MSERGKGWNWTRIVLIGSLSLNLLVVGVFIGSAWRHGGQTKHFRPPETLGSELYRELPRAERRAFWQALREQDGEGRPPHRGADAAALSALLRSVPFDSQAVAAHLQERSSLRNAWLQRVQAEWLTRVGTMSDSDRAAYADRLETAAERRRSWHERRRKQRKTH